MRNKLLVPLFAFSVLAGVNLLVACAQKRDGAPLTALGKAPVSSPGQTSKSPTNGATGSDVDGTSTSGGGTGFDGKVFESYRVVPAELPEYIEFVAPLLANIQSEDPGKPSEFDQVFKMKTWYIAPVDLDKIRKNVLGVSFIKSSTQQIARQTMDEVWIDSRLREPMSPRERADLIVHEFVMNLYLFRFMSMVDICRLTNITGRDQKGDDCSLAAHFDKVNPPEAPRILTEQENINIRFVAGWLSQNAQKPIREKDFVRVLFNKGFDKRLFNPDHYGKNKEHTDLKMSGKEIYRVIKGAELTGQMPSMCSGITTGVTKECKIEIEENELRLQTEYKTEFTLPGFNIGIGIHGSLPVKLAFVFGPDVTLSESNDENGGLLYTLAVAEARENIKIGDRLYSGILFFRKDLSSSQASLVLDSFFVKPGIVTSIDKKRDPICLIQAPRATSLLDDGIVGQRTGDRPNVVLKTYLAMPPFVYCNPSNVNE